MKLVCTLLYLMIPYQLTGLILNEKPNKSTVKHLTPLIIIIIITTTIMIMMMMMMMIIIIIIIIMSRRRRKRNFIICTVRLV